MDRQVIGNRKDEALQNGAKTTTTTTTSSINGHQKSSSPKEQGQIDEVIGNFGKYQFLIFMFKILIGVTSAFNNLGVTFSAPSDFISFWCADQASSLPSSNSLLSNPSAFAASNERLQQQSPDYYYNLAHNKTSSILEYSINNNSSSNSNGALNLLPQQISTQINYQQIFGDFLYNNERRERHKVQTDYNTPKNLRKECKYLSEIDHKQHKCQSHQYNTGIWISTIIDEWNLVCDRAWFVSMIQSLYMSGFIVSFLVFGYISDRFGRWRSLLLGALIEISSGFGCAFSNSVGTYMAFRFLVGLGNAGRSSSSYLIMIEWCGPKWRMHISTLGSLGWIIGYCSMPWITLYFLHFRHMQLFTCFYELIFVIWLLFLPESPRWLLTHRKFDEAYKVLLMAAKFNGLIKKKEECSPFVNSIEDQLHTKTNKTISLTEKGPRQLKQAFDTVDLSKAGGMTDSIEPYTIEEFDLKFARLVQTISVKEFTKNEHRLSIVDLFRWKNLRCYALILFFVWAANSFIYYGIALRVGDFGGTNLFVAFTIAGITELPSLVFTILCMKYMPRGTTNLFIYTTTGILCLIQVPLKHYDYDWLEQTTMMLAKLFNSCAFTCILYQTMELFPTSIRQTAYSSCSLAGRVGSILAPFIKELAQLTNHLVPPIIYATLSFMTAILIKGLPETKGSDLLDTLLEAEKFNGTDKVTETNIEHLQKTRTQLETKNTNYYSPTERRN